MLRHLIVALGLAICAACTPQDHGTGPGPSAPKGPVLDGTVSGGGGNGCNGKPIESYAKRLESLDEYRLYVKPILRRMDSGGRDVLTTYLQFAAEDKAWYFLPCELQTLASEQTGLAIQSDQLARHGEHGVYIYSREGDKVANSYFTKSSKEKAALLLHELVMGAKLLMKKSAKQQCEALTKKSADVCSHRDVIAIAELKRPKDLDAKAAMTLDAVDHEAVRAMTVYLAQKGADLSQDGVREARRRLGFEFLWDEAESKINLKELTKAFSRSRMLGDRYHVAAKPSVYFKDDEAKCTMQLFDTSEHQLGFNTRFVSEVVYAGFEVKDTFGEKHGLGVPTAECQETSGFIKLSSPAGQEKGCKTTVLTWGNTTTWTNFVDIELIDTVPSAPLVEARGVVQNGQVFDEVSVINRGTGHQFHGQSVDAVQVKLLVTRDSAPRIHSIRFEPKQVLRGDGMIRPTNVQEAPKRPDPRSNESEEYLDIPSLPPLECVRE